MFNREEYFEKERPAAKSIRHEYEQHSQNRQRHANFLQTADRCRFEYRTSRLLIEHFINMQMMARRIKLPRSTLTGSLK